MDAIAPHLLTRQSSVDSSADSSKDDDHNSRKRRRPNDPPHEAPPTPGPDATPEERRAARAQRNRIAAQSSRDRRKEEHRYLRDRIAELERENQLLRAGHFLPHALTSPAPSSASLDSPPTAGPADQWKRDISLDSPPTAGPADQWKRDIESENLELRSKVANLERMFALIAPAAMHPLASSKRAHSPPSTGGDRLPGGVGPAAGGHQSALSPLPQNPLALDRAHADWLLSLLHSGHPLAAALPVPAALPVLSSPTTKTEPAADAVPSFTPMLASPFNQGQALPLPPTDSTAALAAALRTAALELTFLPTPSTSSYAGSELDFTEFALEPVQVPEPSAADAASTALVEEMMSKYLNDMVSDQSWAWEACGHDTSDETKDVMTTPLTTTTTNGATEVNVF
ncbi:hypothetical protein CALCODRAFT_478719 [Calocera cornea HHB12733]|uniref:BZIP domain-containing protein n=1 Tax=Calocera cornea HHB12733 TaxID=1353952 RepID=A0A165K834_9BASI|nr:hypothetical protein CALCODRAFT_478719 [Calocera cornea HHB12733]